MAAAGMRRRSSGWAHGGLVARSLLLPDRQAWQAQRITSGVDQFLDECGLGAGVRLAGTKVARQPQLELAVAPRLLRVPAEMIAEQPLVAGRPGGLGHHVQVVGGGVVTVAVLENSRSGMPVSTSS